MRFVVYDIETQNTFSDVGSKDPTALDISVLGYYDSETDSYGAVLYTDLHAFWPFIEKADVLIGFNNDHFDTPLLNKYYPGDLYTIPSLDLMKEVQNVIGRRIGLDAIASSTIGEKKSSHGLQAIKWWKQGKIEEIKEYCIQDVRVTKEVYEYAVNHGCIYYPDIATGKKVEVKLPTNTWNFTGSSITLGFGF